MLSSLERHQDPCSTVANLATRAGGENLQADLALAVASCINEKSATPQKFLRCLAEIFEEFLEGLETLELQHAGRVQLFADTGGGIYDPDLDEDEFGKGVDHLYLPYLTGATWIYRVETDEGLEEITVTVLDETIEIDEIECIVVRDVVTLDGILVEDTFDWYAQHDDGTVWYMGEIARNYEDGQLVDLEGSWRAGEDGAQPGRVMPSTPIVGTT